MVVTSKDDSVWQSITTIARNLDWTVNRVSSSEEALECFHKGNALPAVAFVDYRYQNDKIVDAHQIARYVMYHKILTSGIHVTRMCKHICSTTI